MQAIRRATPADLAILAVVSLVWASSFIAIKIAVPHTGPLWLAASRVTIGFLVLAPFALGRGFIFPGSKRILALVVGTALFNIVVPFFLISWAEQTIDAGIASLLMGTGPFLGLIGSHFLTHDDKMTPQKVVGVLCGFAGIVTIVGLDAISGLGGQHLLAQAAALAGSICYVIAGLLIRRIDLPPIRLACLALGFGSALLLILAVTFDGLPTASTFEGSWAALLYLGIFPTGIAYLVRFQLIRTIGYSTFAMGVNLIPVFGVILGVVLLDEPLTIRVGIALALVVLGLFVSRLSPGRRRPVQAASRPGKNA